MQFAVLVLAGWLQAASLAWPLAFDLPATGILRGQAVWWLQIVSLAVFANSLLHAKTSKQAVWHTWVFSTAWLCGCVWWLYISMHTYGGLPSWLAAFAVFLLSGCMALFYVLFLMPFHHLASANKGFVAIIFASGWMLAELARGTWLTGFPWGAIGYSHVDGPLAGLASSVGVYGMCFIAAFFAMLFAQLTGFTPSGGKNPAVVLVNEPAKSQKPLWLQFAAGAFVVLGIGLIAGKQGLEGLASSQTAAIKVTLLQGNIPQNEKFQAGSGMATALSWYAEQLEKVETGLVVTPETAIPVLPQQLESDYWRNMHQPFIAADSQKAALIGIPMGNKTVGYSNSVLGLKPSSPSLSPSSLALQAPYLYNKDHLVPFGEFIPPFAQWFIDLMNIPLGAFVRGGSAQAPFLWQGQRLGLNICYEDLFGEELAMRFANPTIAPTILVNFTNIAWFGNTVAIDQHLNIARLRSIELAKPSIRATNTGATVIIDTQGKVTHALERHTRGVLVGEVQGNSAITPYAAWVSRFWLWPLWILGLGIVIVALWGSRRK